MQLGTSKVRARRRNGDPTPTQQSPLSPACQLLDEAERLFVVRQFPAAWRLTERILCQLYDKSQPGGGGSYAIPIHSCIPACPCQSAIILGVQLLYEMGRYKEVDAFVQRFYLGEFAQFPYAVFFVW